MAMGDVRLAADYSASNHKTAKCETDHLCGLHRLDAGASGLVKARYQSIGLARYFRHEN